jgi:hypothetical protein
MVFLSSSGCKAPQPFGDQHSLIVAAEAWLWAEIDSAVMGTLEERVFTTRPERLFNVTFVASDDTLWRQMRQWRQLIVFGTREDEVVADLVSGSDDPNATPPAIVQTADKWARGQTVTVLLLPADGQAAAVRALLSDLRALLDGQYEAYVIERMYTTGVNDSLSDAMAEYGFTLQVPNVYLHLGADSLFRLANPYQMGDTDLLRSLVLTWRSGTEPVTPEDLLAWREIIDDSLYDPPQDITQDNIRSDSVMVGGLAALEVRGVWRDRSDFPAAGPFILQAIACPEQDRTYYIDVWLYAPGTDKYPYLRQLEVLLSTFRCI